MKKFDVSSGRECSGFPIALGLIGLSRVHSRVRRGGGDTCEQTLNAPRQLPMWSGQADRATIEKGRGT